MFKLYFLLQFIHASCLSSIYYFAIVASIATGVIYLLILFISAIYT